MTIYNSTVEFGKRRVFIAGSCITIFQYHPYLISFQDAVHVHIPTGGHVRFLIETSPPSLLKIYAEERIPVVAEMMNLTKKILEATID